MENNKSYTPVKIASERSFGIIFGIIFLIIGIYPLLNDANILLWSCITAFIFFILGIFFPKTLFLPNKLWFKFGMILGAVIAPIVMSFIYFFTVFPIGIIMRLFGKDILNLKINKSKKSYWIKRKEPVKTMENQF